MRVWACGENLTLPSAEADEPVVEDVGASPWRARSSSAKDGPETAPCCAAGFWLPSERRGGAIPDSGCTFTLLICVGSDIAELVPDLRDLVQCDRVCHTIYGKFDALCV